MDGIVRVPRLMRAAADAGMPAVALTDHGNLFAMVKFHREAEKQRCQADHRRGLVDRRAGRSRGARAADASRPEPGGIPQPHPARFPQLSRGPGPRPAPACAGMAGRRLDGRADRAFGRYPGRHRPRAARGAVPRMPRAQLERWSVLFGDRFYLEVQRTGRPGEEEVIAGVLSLVATRPTPVVATNDVRFLRARRIRSARGAGLYPRGPAPRRSRTVRAPIQPSST